MKKKIKENREIIIIAIIVIAAVAAAFVFYSASRPKADALAEVNGVKILQEDINEIALTIPQQMKDNVTDAELLEQAINFEIIRQESEKLGIGVTDAEAEANIDLTLQGVGLDRDALKESLRLQKVSWETMFNAYKKQILSYKFINETILRNLTVTENEMKELYNSADLNVSYEEIKSEVNKTIVAAKVQQMLGEFLTQKRMEYNIVRYV